MSGDQLTEAIAQALYENARYYGPEPEQPEWGTRSQEERDGWRKIAAAVLPVVRAAQAEAWDEGYEVGRDDESYWTGFNYYEHEYSTTTRPTPNPYRQEADRG